ncbi:hypothetical protein [Mucilaginibacter ginsenosidivorax]|uniref:DUF4488 domain-containing protein n=1 Tax=Mucilaginibacter ginsenosidivorax TaxID=862126 RepID=A0A5B8VTI9_9SPHI|nr:hypothetical protein [Mucilaginibacter ginsenosidivorax]QEC74759.1 hypothetical protein FSB76_01900 [Mucilaginibacter ginsenosidivorax]
MKTILMICLLGISSMSLHITNHNYNDGIMNKVNSIYGEWSEKKSGPDSARAFRMIFFPGGKVNVIRKLNNYIGYFKIHNDKIDYVDGSITIDDKYPFTATFIEPNKIKLVISYRHKSETKYLVKTKEIKSGFQLLDKNL